MAPSANMSAEEIERLREGVLYTYNEPISIVLLFLNAVVFLTGLAANVSVLLAIFRRSPMDRAANAFMVNLCVCDLLVISLCVPFNAGMEVYRRNVYGRVLCKILPYVQAVSVCTSVFTLTAVSLDRYLVICNPLRAMAFSPSSRVKIVIPCLWVASMLIMLPLAIFSEMTEQTFEFEVHVVFCKEMWPVVEWKRAYDVTLFVVLFVLPLLFMAVAYITIGKTLWHRASVLYGTSDARRNNDVVVTNILTHRRRAVKVFAALTVIFSFSWLPYFHLIIWFDFYEETRRENALTAAVVHPFLLCLGLSNSATNAICYLTLVKNCCVGKYSEQLSRQSSHSHRTSSRTLPSHTREEKLDFDYGVLEMEETRAVQSDAIISSQR
ncbi:HCRTR2 [Branchiostoma lanceolatum]|uniref:HCRTR2 protein n=1 Tax=Branchiostoma lanceolatum TaxID=7740 RepID=A0A8J9ZJG7_BRALA|nr:HCRTR2 [Branchiostoma lanceolatum]